MIFEIPAMSHIFSPVYNISPEKKKEKNLPGSTYSFLLKISTNSPLHLVERLPRMPGIRSTIHSIFCSLVRLFGHVFLMALHAACRPLRSSMSSHLVHYKYCSRSILEGNNWDFVQTNDSSHVQKYSFLPAVFSKAEPRVLCKFAPGTRWMSG